AVRIRVCDGKRGSACQLLFDGDRRLYDVRRPQRRTDLLNRRRGRNRGRIWKRIWIVDYELLLNRSIKAFRSDHVPECESIVENPKTCPQYKLRFSPRLPREGEPRSKITPAPEIALPLIAQTGAEDQVRCDVPLFAKKQPNIGLVRKDLRSS